MTNQVKILGTTMNDNLNWDNHIENEIIPSLKNRNRTLKQITKFMDPKFRTQYINSIFKTLFKQGTTTTRHRSKNSTKGS